MTDRAGQVTSYTYTADDQISSLVFTNATIATPSVSYTYDPVYGRVATMVDGTGTTSYAYHAAGGDGALQVASVDGPLTDDTITYAYDALGRVETREINGSANSVTWVFDALGRVTSETNVLGAFDYTYDGVTSRLATVTYPNGQTSAYTYLSTAEDRRLETIHHQYPGGAALSQFDYTYDAAGNILTWRQQADTDAVLWKYGYDAADQLTAATKESTDPTPVVLQRFAYGYDAAGNRTSEQIDDSITQTTVNAVNELVSQTVGGPLRFAGSTNEPAAVTIDGVPAATDAANGFRGTAATADGTNTLTVSATDASGNQATQQYQVDLSGSSKTFTYDANGNLTSDGTRTFEWDARNQLVAVTLGTHRSEFTYDSRMRRVRMTEKDDNVTQDDTRFVWCGGAVCEECDPDAYTVRRRLFAHGEQVGTTIHYMVVDHVASVVAVTDASASLVARYAFDPWGDRELVAGGDSTTIGFTHDRHHSESGTVLTQYRLFDSQLARWLSEDPAGSQDGQNRYSYVTNNPVRYVDPSGLATWKCAVSLATYGTFPVGAGIKATCTSDCVGGRQLTQTLIGLGTGGSFGLPGSYSYAEYTLHDSFGGPSAVSLAGKWLYSGAGLAGGVVGGSYTSLTLGAATSGAWKLDWEAGADASLDAFSGFTVAVNSKWSDCKCK